MVPAAEERVFLNENHLQGYTASIACLGLVNKDDELIEIMSFGRSRFTKQYDTELLRLCTKKDCIVYGGASKLFNEYIKDHNTPIVSYCNESVFEGKVYNVLGFTKIGTTNSYYYKAPNGDIILRYAMQKSSIKRANGIKENIQKTLERYGAIYDPNKTEKENAEAAHFEFCTKVEATWVWGREWYIYEITNNINGKTYIGQHIKKDENFNIYLGSGTNIRRAVEKYGKENFTKRILVDNITSKEDVDRIELEEINKAKAIGKAEYNIITDKYLPSVHVTTDSHSDWITNLKTSHNTPECKERNSEVHKGQIPWNKGKSGLQVAWNKGLSCPHTTEWCKNQSTKMTGAKNSMYGKKHTEESKRKMSENHKGKTAWNKGKKMGPAWNKGIKMNKPAWNKGKSTSLKWYNNGTESKMFKENEQPEGWVRGRLPSVIKLNQSISIF